MNKTLIIVSYFDLRPKKQLNNLVNQLKNLNAPILLSINSNETKHITLFKDSKINILKRPNIGMNIGAWNDATSLAAFMIPSGPAFLSNSL